MVAVATGICQPLEGYERGALCRHQAVCVGMERPGLSALAHGAKSREAHVDEQIVGAVHSAGEGEIDRAVLQLVAGDLDGIERAGAGGIQTHHLWTEAQRFLDQIGGP